MGFKNDWQKKTNSMHDKKHLEKYNTYKNYDYWDLITKFCQGSTKWNTLFIGNYYDKFTFIFDKPNPNT